jgi:DNA-directed RNA polymerase sigma subunit (sigma70/sigma32)
VSGHWLQAGDLSVLDDFLRDIERCPLLSESEEAALHTRIAAGNEAASVALVSANLRYVVVIARRYTNRGLPLDRLIDLGSIGLVRAARRWDASSGVRFRSFAAFFIRHAILIGLEGVLQPTAGLSSSAGLADPEWWNGIRQDAELEVFTRKRSIPAELLFDKIEPILVAINRIVLGITDDSVITFEELGKRMGWPPEVSRRLREDEIRKLKQELDQDLPDSDNPLGG